MECDNEDLLHEWVAAWSDILNFEIHPVMTRRKRLIECSAKAVQLWVRSANTSYMQLNIGYENMELLR